MRVPWVEVLSGRAGSVRTACAVLAALVLGCCCAPRRVHAHALNLQLLLPSAGRTAAITIPDLAPPPHGTLRLQLSANHAREPWTRPLDCGAAPASGVALCDAALPENPRLVLARHLTQVELSAGFALFETLQLGVVLPFATGSLIDNPELPRAYETRSGFGDLRLSVDAPIITGDSALGFSLLVTLPTGNPATALSEERFSVRPALVAAQRLASLRLSLLAGYRARRHAEIFGLVYDDEIELALGALHPIVSGLDARVELRGRIGITRRGAAEPKHPVELDAALGYAAGKAFGFLLGAGAGVWPGRDGYGAPTLRVFAAMSFEHPILSCRFGPEDRDGHRDNDSCRDPDDDRDGLDDLRDECPNDAEDRDGFDDRDGCPEADNDADGKLDNADRCPVASEDRDGFEDTDGCPEPDNDADRLLDALDGCPLDPEDRDDFEDGDGCPEPGPTPLSVSVGERSILVSERIYFDDGRDTIREVSRPVLDQVAAVIRNLRPELKVIVEGHTDDAGTPAHNLDLSHRRARAVVEYLRGRGVPPQRIDYVGYGSTRPLGPNDSPEGRALNRRVEFTITH